MTRLPTETHGRKVLAVDDSPVNLTLLKVHLDRMGLEVILASGVAQALELARKEKPDLILLDIMMPEIDGFEGCRMFKADPQTASIPIIFITACDQPIDKVTGLQLGASDYITKPFDPCELKARIALVLQTVSLQEELVARANTDELTGLTNRRSFSEMLQREIRYAEKNNKPLSLAMLDIDHFKNVNDTFGHLGGDVVLRQVAEVLRDNVAAMDVVGRFGGEEFIVLMPQTPHDKAMLAAARLRKLIADCRWKISAEPVSVTVSIGVASLDNEHPCDGGELVKRADIALYMAKNRGRNTVISGHQVELQNKIQSSESRNIREIIRQMDKLGQQLRQNALLGINTITAGSYIHQEIQPHHRHVVRYCQIIAEQFGLAEEFIKELTLAAELHDIGKISLPIECVMSPMALDVSQRELYEQHPLLGVRILEPLGLFHRELQYIKHHHERFDGLGYPDRLKGKDIPFGARILTLANAFDNLTNPLQSSETCEIDEAVERISSGTNSEFDPAVVEAFLNVVRNSSQILPSQDRVA